MTFRELPTIRRLIVPDPGYTLVDADYERADAQFVAWEANEPELKHIFQTGADVYTDEAKWLYEQQVITKDQRFRLKSVVHASNYAAKARTLGMTAGVSTARMDDWLRKRWYGRFPGIPRWHKDVARRLRFEREVRNIWGFRRYYFDANTEAILPQALAWLCQSGVAITINKAMMRLYSEANVELLLQVHDSLLMQIPTPITALMIPIIRDKMRIVIPYSDPLIIPTSIKTSTKSWGDMKVDAGSYSVETGAWQYEPDEAFWIDKTSGLPCLMCRSQSGAWCGYVGVPAEHATFQKDYYYSDTNDPIEIAINGIQVHGGLTFAGERDAPPPYNAWYFFGFDCAHAGDLLPAHEPRISIIGDSYRDMQYVRNECRLLAEQLGALWTEAAAVLVNVSAA